MTARDRARESAREIVANWSRNWPAQDGSEFLRVRIEQALLAAEREGLGCAAFVCAEIAAKWSHHSVAPFAAKECEKAIRKLMEAE